MYSIILKVNTEIKTAQRKKLLTQWLWPYCASDSPIAPKSTYYPSLWVIYQPNLLNTSQ